MENLKSQNGVSAEMHKNFPYLGQKKKDTKTIQVPI